MKLTPKKVKQLFNEEISNIASNPQLFSLTQGGYSRTRKLPLDKMLRLILSMSGEDLKCEIMDFFNFNINLPSVSAFVQQRDKLSYTAFEHLFHNFTDKTANLKLFHGFRLLAVDGSDIHTPTNKEDTDSFYPGTNNQRPYNLFHLNALYDLVNRIYSDAVIQPSHSQNEHRAFATMVDHNISNIPTIYIADRGFEAYNNLAHVQEAGQFYLIRVKDITGNGVISAIDLPETDEFDINHTYTLTRKQTNDVKADQNLKYLPHNVNFDFLPSRSRKHDPLITYTISCRIVRIKISEDKYETLITNLPADSFSDIQLKELYSMRWGIETSFRELKYTVGLIYFHSKKTEGIFQEIFAKLTMYNFYELIVSCVVLAKKERKYQYHVNFSAAVHASRSFFLNNSSPSELEKLLSRYIVPIRQSVSNVRKMTSKSAVYFIYRVA